MSHSRPRCCRRDTRCRSCPLRLRADLRAVEALAVAEALPPHLAGVPECLHRYEPLLRKLAEGGGAPPPRAPSELPVAGAADLAATLRRLPER